MKFLISLLLLISFSFTSAKQAQAEMVDRIVARVGSTMITQSDVNDALKNLESSLSFIKDPAERAKKRDAFKNDAVNTLINEKLLEQEMDKENINITDVDVDRALQAMAARYQTNLDGLKARMAEQGVTYDKYRHNLKKDLKREEFLKKVIYPRVKITDYDLEAYYKRHGNDFMGFSQLHFLEILINDQTPTNGLAPDVFASQLVTSLRRGTDFRASAKKYSRGPFAANGGDSGTTNTADMRVDLVNFLLNLNTNEISDPVTTPNGILIFKLLEKKNPKPRAFNDVKELVRAACGQAQVGEEMENFVRELRGRSFVEVK